LSVGELTRFLPIWEAAGFLGMSPEVLQDTHRPLDILSALRWENHSSKHDLIGPTPLLPR